MKITFTENEIEFLCNALDAYFSEYLVEKDLPILQSVLSKLKTEQAMHILANWNDYFARDQSREIKR